MKRLVLGGEKVPQGMRRKLLEMMHVLGSDGRAVMATYGLTEAEMAWLEYPGTEGRGGTGYHLSPDLVLVEVIDPETGLAVDDACPGEIVIYSAASTRHGGDALPHRRPDRWWIDL